MNLSLARPLPDGVGYITQTFGQNPADYARFGQAGHCGADYGAPLGTPVLACHPGVVSVVGWDELGYGNFVRVQGLRWQTLYAHLSVVSVVKDQEVRRGTKLGEVGSTGNSTGPHLHLAIRLDGGKNPAYSDYVDPLPYRFDE